MKKGFLIITLFFLIGGTLFGQSPQSLNFSIPTSPQAEAFKQYGEYAVNYSTGVPDISIPLYELNHRGYKLPLELKYFPSPLKPGYNHDVYGHGWGLSINSCVSRSINSRPDEATGFTLLDQEVTQRKYYPYSNDATPIDLRPFNLARDQFNAILPNGTSFDFMILKGSDGYLEYKVSGDHKVIIDCEYDSNNIRSFTIKDIDGVKYTFNKSDTFLPLYTGSSYPLSNVSWLLTQIDLPIAGPPIRFAYNNSIQSYDSHLEPEVYVNFVYHRDPKPGIVNNLYNYIPGSYKMELLTAISYGTTLVSFDYHNPNSSAAHDYVDKIVVSDNGKIIKKIGFGRSTGAKVATLKRIVLKGTEPTDSLVYSLIHSVPSSSSGTDHWGYLNHQTINHNVGNFTFYVGFDFEYYSPHFTTTVVNQIPKSDEDLCPYDKLRLGLTNMDYRRPSGPNSHGILQKIIYPTGGYTRFVFENHEFLTQTDSNGDFILNREDRIKARAGGFRIREITNYDKDDKVLKTINYRYGELYKDIYGPDHARASEYSGLGVAVVDPNILTYMDYSYIRNETPVWGFTIRNMILGLSPQGQKEVFHVGPFDENNCCETWTYELTFSANNFRRIVKGRPPVLYPMVTIIYGDINDSPYDPAFDKTIDGTIGKTIVYNNGLLRQGMDLLGNLVDDVFIDEPFYYRNTIMANSSEYRYYNTSEKLHYMYEPNSAEYFKLVKKEIYNWGTSSRVVLDYAFTQAIPKCYYYPGGLSVPIRKVPVSSFLIQNRTEFGVSKLGSVNTEHHYDGRVLVESTSYGYNDRKQLVSKTFVDSQNRTVKEEFEYPTDQEGTPFEIQELYRKHILTPVIGSKTTVNGAVSGVKVEYKDFSEGNLVLRPSAFYELEIDPPSVEYVVKSEVRGYTANGNPIEIWESDGVLTSALWGYDDRYLVVEARNIEHSELENLVVASLPSGFVSLESLLGSITELPDSNWTLFNTNLRDARAKASHVQVITYTHDPLIGTTSKTDPNGISTYYEYDNFGRLRLIRDNDGNIVEQNEYKYKNK